MSNKKFDLFSRIDELPSRLYIILGIVAMAVYTAICTYTKLSQIRVGLAIILIYALLCFVIFIFSRRRIAIYRAENRASEEQNGGVVSAFRDSISLPYAVVTEKGRIVTVNSAMKQMLKENDSFFNSDIEALFNLDIEQIIASTNSEKFSDPSIEDDSEGENNELDSSRFTAISDSGRYEINCYPIRSSGHVYYMLTFTDTTELYEITKLHRDTTPAVAYIVVDNLEEIAQYVTGGHRNEATQVEAILKDWATKMNGILREYDRDKYILFFTRDMLEECVKNSFSVLDSIRQVRTDDDSIPLTVSMGISIVGNTLAEREKDALTSLNLALQRGGDQVVLRSENGISYYGGHTKSQQKRTRVHSRIIANKLSSMMSGASNVLVMGHSNPDFDSIGACVGIASLAMHLGVDVKIVTDTSSANFIACTEKIRELDEYKNVFTDAVGGLGRCTYGTLLVIVDTNNFSILEAPEIAEKSFNTVVIDHHIKKEEFENEPALAYIDPSASSACELVSEILEQSLPTDTLKKEEATVMLSGIMVDTKNFTRTVGTRTFSAALYLRGAGANTEIARTFFNEAFEDYRSEALFGARVEIYRGNMAITESEGTGSAHDRIAAAKAADKLLSVREVSAAFALVRIGEAIHISARSSGTVNVQLILEQLGGGGHFDMAGAAVSDRSLDDAKSLLIGAIDKYIDEMQKNSK